MDGKDEKNEKNGGLFAKLKSKKGIEIIIAIVIIAIIISIYLSTLSAGSAGKQPSGAVESQAASAERTEKRLMEVLSSIKGAGRVEVMITYETSSEIVPALNTDKQTTVTESATGDTGSSVNRSENEVVRPVTVQQADGTGAIVLKEIEPAVRGVIVIAQGADDIRVKMSLLQAVQTVLNVSSEKIDVFVMKSDD